MKLSTSQKNYYEEGNQLNSNSKYNDHDVKCIVQNELKKYAEKKLADSRFTVNILYHITTKECYDMVKLLYPDFPDSDYTNDKTCMKPDGGIMYAIDEKCNKYPIIIIEDKTQGTNDRRKSSGMKRQALGNAIERGAKNLNLAKTLFRGLTYFPYIIFASGCDFHKTETIPRRLEQMNGLMPNHYIDVGYNKFSIEEQLETTLNNINIMKRYGNQEYATICIKSHKWDELPHGSSNWTREERIKICKKVIDQAVEEIIPIPEGVKKLVNLS